MRLIGTITSEQRARQFCDFLLEKNIRAMYENAEDDRYHIWIEDEDHTDKAHALLLEFEKDPESFKVEKPSPSKITPFPVLPESSEPSPPIVEEVKRVRKRGFQLTRFFLILCSVLFFWNMMEAKKGIEGTFILTPMQRVLFFDYPDTLKDFSHRMLVVDKEVPVEQQILEGDEGFFPVWLGFYNFLLHSKEVSWKTWIDVPFFEKIRQGEIWRLFTPCLLHAGLLHILFNMYWLWILGRQIEDRIGWKRFLLLILLTGIISNVAQYLMSGPYFLGFSGVDSGLFGFIWMRQKRAPWEGYPLERRIILFIFGFFLVMFFIQVMIFLLQLLSLFSVQGKIANTAHIVGGLVGIILGRFPLFARRHH